MAQGNQLAFNIVLVHPAIPQNTGNIARMTAATRCALHLIHPMSFEINDRQVKRAGLDYWPEVNLVEHKNWQDFLTTSNAREDQLWFFSTKATNSYHQVKYNQGDFLVFGSETSGLPAEYHQRYPERRLLIPFDNPNIRSLNLANSVAIALFEARRQSLDQVLNT